MIWFSRMRLVSRRPARWVPFWAAVLISLSWRGESLAQTNFKPLERGDFTEEEERVIVLKGIAAHVDYALRLEDLSAGDAPNKLERTRVDQDVRLTLKTALHRDIEVALVLEPFQQPLSDTNLRQEPATDRGRVADGQTFAINAREAYLRYLFNPNSALVMGRHEVSIADRRGLLFDAIVPALTFDCAVGTWCMPFGALKVGNSNADWIYHWALEYRAWDEKNEGRRDGLRVEIYRIWYTERDVPLGRNMAPGVASPDPTMPNDTSVTDDGGNPIFYDVHGDAAYGLNAGWDSGPIFLDFNFVDNQGSRRYHRARVEGEGIGQFDVNSGLLAEFSNQKVRGWATHTEFGFRWPTGRLGLRWLYANGDPDRPFDGGRQFLRGLRGFYEITPGAYQGARLYFNGTDPQVDSGAGLGHSVTNTNMFGGFLEFDDPETTKVGYHTALLNLRHFYGVYDTHGELQDDIGLEWDNMLTWYIHKAARLQFEGNFLKQGMAFSYNDFTPPDRRTDLIIQAIVRFVYVF